MSLKMFVSCGWTIWLLNEAPVAKSSKPVSRNRLDRQVLDLSLVLESNTWYLFDDVINDPFSHRRKLRNGLCLFNNPKAILDSSSAISWLYHTFESLLTLQSVLLESLDKRDY